jgi:hypothetical protein
VTVLNVEEGPVCTAASAEPAILWPPNHRLVKVRITSVSGGAEDDDDDDNHDDRDGRRHDSDDDDRNDDPHGITVVITKVTQDERVDSHGDEDTRPDGIIDGSSVLLRAERNGQGNGRVYQITFTAADSRGGQCSGAVTVGVPQDAHKPAIDDGQQFDSTQRASKSKPKP